MARRSRRGGAELPVIEVGLGQLAGLAVILCVVILMAEGFRGFVEARRSPSPALGDPAPKPRDAIARRMEGALYLVPDDREVTTADLNAMMRGEESGGILTWSGPHGDFTSAPGRDRRQHFMPGYLVGYAPFPVTQVWMPLYVAAERLRYQLDLDHFPGRPEVWLNSWEAFAYVDGDCEDHAIAVADWLIEMGYDARVVIGSMDGGGHAWVVLFLDGETFLLEATDKRRRRNAHYPLAALETGYVANWMFDRGAVWQNADPLGGGYEGNHWQLRGRFEALAEAPPPPVPRFPPILR